MRTLAITSVTLTALAKKNLFSVQIARKLSGAQQMEVRKVYLIITVDPQNNTKSSRNYSLQKLKIKVINHH